MPVLFKFRSSVGFDAVDLGGRPSISVRDLRARVVEQKNLQICADSRLVVFDAGTGEAHEDEEFMIPDGSSVIIKPVPAAPGNGGAVGIGHAAAQEDFLGALVSSRSEHVAMDNFDDFVNDLLPAVGALLLESDSDERSINSFKRRKPDDGQRCSESPVSRCQNQERSILREVFSKENVGDNYDVDCDANDNVKQSTLQQKEDEHMKLAEAVDELGSAETSALLADGGGFNSYPADLLSASQRFYAEQSNFIRPSDPEMEGRNYSLAGNSPHFNNSGSPTIELDVFPRHGVEWPTGVRATSLPLGDSVFGSILERVRVVVRAEDPPSIEAVRHALEQNTVAAFYMGLSRDSWMVAVEEIWDEVRRLHATATWNPCDHRIQILESDKCSMISNADEFNSRVSEVRKRRKTRQVKMAEERERIARLEREIDELRSFLDKEAKKDEDEAQEMAALVAQVAELRQTMSFKAKEIRRLKRKKLQCLYFAI